jgi:hypothetical protein
MPKGHCFALFKKVISGLDMNEYISEKKKKSLLFRACLLIAAFKRKSCEKDPESPSSF